MPQSADFVFPANAFHGVPDQTRLLQAVRDMLVSGGCFAIVNWYQRTREAKVILSQPRGPKTELRMSPDQVVAVMCPSELKLRLIVDIPPYHYGAVLVHD